jgi:hypothetical protein
MKTAFSAIFCLALSLFFIGKTEAQAFLGASLGFLDSAPAPTVGGNAFVGVKIPLGFQSFKLTGGYLQSFIPSKSEDSRTVFSGFFAKATPEITMTDDRTNPFKFNAGVAFFGGKYYKKARIYTPGFATGIVWGFDSNDKKLEIVGDLFGFLGKKTEGSFSSRMHLMAFLGLAIKL